SFFFIKDRVSRLLHEFKPELVHAHSVDSSAFVARRIKNDYSIPYIITVRGFNNASKNMMLENISEASKLIFVSPSQRCEFATKYVYDATTMPHGIDDQIFADNSTIIPHGIDDQIF